MPRSSTPSAGHRAAPSRLDGFTEIVVIYDGDFAYIFFLRFYSLSSFINVTIIREWMRFLVRFSCRCDDHLTFQDNSGDRVPLVWSVWRHSSTAVLDKSPTMHRGRFKAEDFREKKRFLGWILVFRLVWRVEWDNSSIVTRPIDNKIDRNGLD